MDASMMARLQAPEEENHRLKKMVAEERLKTEIVQAEQLERQDCRRADSFTPHSLIVTGALACVFCIQETSKAMVGILSMCIVSIGNWRSNCASNPKSG